MMNRSRMKRYGIVFFLFLCSLLTKPLFAGEQPFPEATIPPYHWSNRVIIFLVDAGVLDLDITIQPFTRGQVANALKNAEKKKESRGKVYQELYNRLIKEFSPEMIAISGKVEEEQWSWRAGFYSQGEVALSRSDRQSSDNETDAVLVSYAGARFYPGLYAHSSARVDSYLRGDSTYKGSVYRGYAGYAEQAYLTVRWKRISGWIGRNWLRWGPGRSGTLLLSDYSRPYTAAYLNFSFKPFHYSWIVGELDRRQEIISRYFSAHRLGIRLHRNLQIALSELLVYAGENRSWELRLMNPVSFWQTEQNSGVVDGNGIFSLAIYWKPTGKFSLGYQFLVDDYQIERKKPEDLEPAEIGGMATVAWVEPVGLENSRVVLEGAFVTQRTYNSTHGGERILHFNRPIGWFGNNDVIYWKSQFDYLLSGDKWLSLDASYQIKGEDYVSAPFDTTYLNYTVEQGYDEPFPTGTPIRTFTLGLESTWYPHDWIYGSTRIEWFRKRNMEHIAGMNDTGIRVSLKLVMDLSISGRQEY